MLSSISLGAARDMCERDVNAVREASLSFQHPSDILKIDLEAGGGDNLQLP